MFTGNVNKGEINQESQEGTNFISQFFTNDKNTDQKENGSENISENTSSQEDEENNTEIKKLIQISEDEIAGYTVFNKERFKKILDVEESEDNKDQIQEYENLTSPDTEYFPAIRYVKSENGYIYQTFLDDVSLRKFSGTKIPNVKEALFTQDGQSVLMRYLDENENIITFTGELEEEVLGIDYSTETEIKGNFLPEKISHLSILNPEGRIFYLYKVGDKIRGVVSSMKGSGKTNILNSSFTEWLPQWPKANTITLTTKASGLVPGYMYELNPETESFEKILSGIDGLTTNTSPNGKITLYTNNFLEANLYNKETRESKSLGIKTLAEKCTWSEDSTLLYCGVPKNINSSFTYPDSWYMGEVSFSDNMWKINTQNQKETILLNPSNFTDEKLDVTNIQTDNENNYLLFVNKKDSTLWSAKLN